MSPLSSAPTVETHLRTRSVEGLDIFYREAGSTDRPTEVLLHGFPTSSHMIRHLIPALAGAACRPPAPTTAAPTA